MPHRYLQIIGKKWQQQLKKIIWEPNSFNIPLHSALFLLKPSPKTGSRTKTPQKPRAGELSRDDRGMNEPLSGKRNKLPLSEGSLLGMAGAVNKDQAQRLFFNPEPRALLGVRPGLRARRQRLIFAEEMERIRACSWFCLSEGGGFLLLSEAVNKGGFCATQIQAMPFSGF